MTEVPENLVEYVGAHISSCFAGSKDLDGVLGVDVAGSRPHSSSPDEIP